MLSIFFLGVLAVLVLIFSNLVSVSSPQSRSFRTSVRSTAGSRGDGSWKGPSTRPRPVAPVMPRAPVPPSTLPAPHQVGEFTGCHAHTVHELLFITRKAIHVLWSCTEQMWEQCVFPHLTHMLNMCAF